MATKEPQYLTIFSILTRSTGSMLLLSPHQPSYWSALCDNPEWWGSVPNSMNRWLHEIIETLAQVTGSKPHLSFGGPSTHSSRAPWTTTCHGKALSDWPYISGGRPFGVLSQRFKYQACNSLFTSREPLTKPHTALRGGACALWEQIAAGSYGPGRLLGLHARMHRATLPFCRLSCPPCKPN